ncbi:hypothetical protein [Marinobacterium lutimaris]|uniref:hypothetical protein n=1 Tax=Marinobacterium lutimaris TaxID=568106 RepID=UPI001359AE75|nr:hypothetical protein [Marinobacterium lutimaris]
MSKADPQFCLANAAQDLRGAVLSLYVSSGMDVLPKVPEEIMVLESQLSGGDLRAFEK